MAALDTAALTSVISAASGLAGVALGGAITYWRETRHEKTRASADLSYLSLLVAAHLDQLVDACIEVAHDDGTDEYGAPSTAQGVHHPTTSAPNFAPLELDVNWKIVPRALMQEILDLPAKLQRVRRQVSADWDDNDVPDFTISFWARQTAYAGLGLAVLDLAKRLRAAARLPIHDYVGMAHDPQQILKARLDTIAQEKAAREVKIAARKASRQAKSAPAAAT